jgi:hypothetical protein
MAHTQEAMCCNYFFIEAVLLPTLLQAVWRSHEFYLCCLPPVSQQQSLRQQGGFADIIFLFELLKL